jgi:predicted Zn-dependent protease
MAESTAAAIDPRIVDWSASVEVRHATHRLVTSEGGDVVQRYRMMLPGLAATAHADGDTQTRTLNATAASASRADPRCSRALRLRRGRTARRRGRRSSSCSRPTARRAAWTCCSRPTRWSCRSTSRSAIPLELDRILGDERNFAGTSFVTPDMFGSYRYGSPLLNVTFDPTRAEELASYGYDDEGTPAERTF